MLRQELCQVFLPRLLKDGQVATAERTPTRQNPAAGARDMKLNNTEREENTPPYVDQSTVA